ncbi:epoxide hydrolase 4-like [Anopheles nili]|uniref:epoxide hydrolase 4-like n=1 Tax=Anopheles nili TaxID=185578 RepID=UPI00237BA9EF|nr:epoxide hydrolase 4-like [Anopheles nili]
MYQIVIACLRRAAIVCRQFLWRIIGLFHVAYWIPIPRPHPPDTLNHPKWGTHQYIKVGKIKLHYVEKGSSSKPLVLFLHGLPDFWYTWRYQLNTLSRDYWTVAVDLIGCGQSDQAPYNVSYKLWNQAMVISRLVKALGKTDCVLVGSGYGALLGWHVVHQYPQVVSRYVMLGTPSVVILQDLVRRGSISLRVLLQLVPFLCPNRLIALLARAGDYAMFDRLLGARTAKPQDLEAYKYTFARPNALENAITAARETIADFFHEDSEFRVRKPSNTPGLFLFATEDRWIDPDECTTLLMDMYRPLETRLVPGTARMMHQDEAGTVNRLISEFLARDVRSRVEEVMSGDDPKAKIVLKEVCDNCYGKEHSKAAHDHAECANNCDGEALRHYFTKIRFPICS